MVRAMILARIPGMAVGANIGGRLGVLFIYKWLGRKTVSAAEAAVIDAHWFPDEA